jgi:predicted RND superfamily exporter protein
MNKLSLSKRFETRFAETRITIDRGLERWGYWVYDHAWYLLAACALVLGLLISQIPRMVTDTSTEGFLHEDDPFRIAYNEFRFQFGRDERVLLLIDSGEGHDIFSVSFLEKLQALHNDLEQNVPKLQHVDSLMNARLTRGEKDQLIVKNFLEDLPKTEAEVAAIKQRALANELYVNQFVSRDGRYAVIMIENDAYSSTTNEKYEPS